MKNKTFKSSGHGNGKEHVPSKYDANLRKNGALYFQFGLILSLLMVWGVFQIKFPASNKQVAIEVEPDYDIDKYFVGPVRVEQEQKQQAEEIPAPEIEIPDEIDEFDVKPDDADIVEVTEEMKAPSEMPTTSKPVIRDLVDEGDTEPVFYNIKAVQEVPVFPGCEKLATNAEKEACLSDKLRAFIGRNFNTNAASEYGLTGKQRIYVQFKIDENGNIADIETRAPSKVLENEAERVIKKIPKMTPGKVQKKSVSVKYAIPIVFEVKN